ncbi:MAG: hypothetical protein Q7J04_10375, partial [Microcella sp.]|nr:hypothetical protein [Microcella sp.]
MTDEFPWATESSDKNTSPTNDKLESLGFSFFEKSSTHQPESAGDPGYSAIVEPVRQPELTAPDLADVATAALVPFGTDHSTALVPMSRRALRDAERSQSTSRRS